MASQSPLFRAQAREYYAQSREKAVLPRLVTPPVFLCLWILLGLLLMATVLAWQVQVPIYATASGAIIQQPTANQPTMNAPSLVLFVPANPAPTLHVGAPLTVQVTLTGASFTGSIIAVEPGVLTPEQVRPALWPYRRPGAARDPAFGGGAGADSGSSIRRWRASA